MRTKHIIQHISLAAFFYLLGSFVAASFNISLWHEALRATFAIIYGVVALCMAGYQEDQSL